MVILLVWVPFAAFLWIIEYDHVVFWWAHWFNHGIVRLVYWCGFWCGWLNLDVDYIKIKLVICV